MSMATLGYYPGCSGLGTSMEYDRSTRAVCKSLSVPLEDVADWNCCGSTPAHTVDHGLSTALSARNFAQAEDQGLDHLVTPCPSCLKNLRTALVRMEDEAFKKKAEALMDRSLKREHTVRSVLQVLAEDLPEGTIAGKVSRLLTGLKVVPYYGCLMNRPADLMRFDDVENPTSMDRLMETLGATVLPFPLKVECCGASMGIPRNDAVTRLSSKLLNLAASLGAEAIVVACPLCQMNLDLRQGQINDANGTKHNIPVFYYTQLLGLALGLPEAELGFDKLAVDPKPLLADLSARAATSGASKKTEDAA